MQAHFCRMSDFNESFSIGGWEGECASLALLAEITMTYSFIPRVSFRHGTRPLRPFPSSVGGGYSSFFPRPWGDSSSSSPPGGDLFIFPLPPVVGEGKGGGAACGCPSPHPHRVPPGCPPPFTQGEGVRISVTLLAGGSTWLARFFPEGSVYLTEKSCYVA
jgi:hypothetical protein